MRVREAMTSDVMITTPSVPVVANVTAEPVSAVKAWLYFRQRPRWPSSSRIKE